VYDTIFYLLSSIFKEEQDIMPYAFKIAPGKKVKLKDYDPDYDAGLDKEQGKAEFMKLDYLRAGDSLVVWRLDHLGRSLKHLIETIVQLQERGIGFRSITENIDTTTIGIQRTCFRESSSFLLTLRQGCATSHISSRTRVSSLDYSSGYSLHLSLCTG
jgi:hypothetical protein